MPFEQDSTSECAESPGSRFQAARQSQGASLAQMSAVTRIQENYLQALEEDRFDRLPPQVFAKGFVRSYARSLNLDEDHCARLFSECSMSFYKKIKDQPMAFPRLKDSPDGKANRYMVVFFLGVIVLGVLVLLREPSPSNPENVRNAVDLETAVPATSVELAPVPSSPPSESVVSDSPPLSSAAGLEDAPLVLELQASEVTWVVVRSDDGEGREAILQPGERTQWRAHDRFLLTLGNAGGVEVTLNGRRQGPFGEAGTVVRDVELRL